MRLWKLPDQVIRIGVLLVALVAITVILRQRFVPESFGEIGHYRADSIELTADQEIRYAGSQICAECHEQGESKAAS